MSFGPLFLSPFHFPSRRWAAPIPAFNAERIELTVESDYDWQLLDWE